MQITRPMLRVVVTGAEGNVGKSVIEALAERDEVGEIIGLVGAEPSWSPRKTSWSSTNVVSSDLAPVFEGADVVIHLAWATQPSHNRQELERINVEGSRRVFDAVAAAEVPKLIYASTVGAYSPAPKDRLIGEDWPLGGSESSFHARFKTTIEGHLDAFESLAPSTKVVRLRPALTFRGDSATELCRLLVGPFIPSFLLRNRLLPAIPRLAGLCFQAIHTSDLARAYALATIRDVSGPFNLASNPPLSADDLAASLDTGTFPLPYPLARRLADVSWRLRLQPTPPDWLDTVMRLPLMSSERASRELGWEPHITAVEALAELFTDLRDGSGGSAPAFLGSLAPVAQLSEMQSRTDSEQRVRGEAEQKLVDQLAEAHSIGEQAVAQVQRVPQIANGPLAEIFTAHLSESEGQVQRVRGRLEAYGVDIAGVDGRSGGIGLAVFAESRPDSPSKLIAHAFSYAHMEIAFYELLRKTAGDAGDEATAAMAHQSGEEAQRMADRLEASFDLAVDACLNGSGERELDSQLNRCLADVHAIERQGLQLLEIAPKVIEDEALRGLFRRHLRESEEHGAMLRERLEARGAEPAKASDAVLRIGGMQVGAFFAAQPDTTAKLLSFAAAFEQLEIAAYELLERIARRAGDSKVTGAAERILAEERAAFDRLSQAVAGS
jgi:ferritin-like metal-binding protein YciE/nucleoside-diphosphate-sugar epimerase